MTPNFFVVGAQKSGTTSLYNYLYDHPDIYLPTLKETKFFIRDELYNKGMKFYEQEYFSSWNGQAAVGEIDPDYMYIQIALDRIVKQIRSPKLIFIFRNPVERAFSHYLMTYRRGREPLSFSDAIHHESERINQGFIENMDYSYVARGYYDQQVRHFLSKFDRSKVLFILSDDLRINTRHCIKQCCDFLGVDNKYLPGNLQQQFHQANIPKNVALYRAIQYQSPLRNLARLLVPGKKMRKKIRDVICAWNTTNKINMTISEETRQYLIGLYRDENLRLGELIGRDLSHWNQ